MTDEKMLELARHAGFEPDCCSKEWHVRMRKFAALVRRYTEKIAMTEIGNFIIEHDAELTTGRATGCRCMCCHSFKITEDDGNLGRVLCENESMDGLLADIRALAAQEGDK